MEPVSNGARDLHHTVSQLLPGFEQLFFDHAVPDSAGYYFLERSFLSFFSPVVDKYTHKYTVLQAFQSIHALEKQHGSTRPGLTFQGMIAAMCKVSEDTFVGPIWTAFPSPSDRLRLQLFLCDTAQRYFKHAISPAAVRYEDAAQVLRDSVPIDPATAGPSTRLEYRDAVRQVDALSRGDTLHRPVVPPLPSPRSWKAAGTLAASGTDFRPASRSDMDATRLTTAPSPLPLQFEWDRDRTYASVTEQVGVTNATQQPPRATSVSPLDDFFIAVAHPMRQTPEPRDILSPGTLVDATLRHAQEVEAGATARTKRGVLSPVAQLRQSWAQRQADIDEFLLRLSGAGPASKHSNAVATASVPRDATSPLLHVEHASHPAGSDASFAAAGAEQAHGAALQGVASSIADTRATTVVPSSPERGASPVATPHGSPVNVATEAWASLHVVDQHAEEARPTATGHNTSGQPTSPPASPSAARQALPEHWVPRQLPAWTVTMRMLLTAGSLNVSQCERVIAALFERYCLYGERDRGVSTVFPHDNTRVLRMNMNQFAKFAQDAGVVGRGGHGGGAVTRSDVDIMFKSAAARMAGAGSQPAHVKMWKQNSYTMKVVARSMLNLGLDYLGFTNALLLLAARRYCRPDSRAVTLLGMSAPASQAVPLYPMTSKAVLRAHAEEAELVEWLDLYGSAVSEKDAPIAAAVIGAVAAMRLLLLNQVIPLAIRIGLLDGLPPVISQEVLPAGVEAWDALPSQLLGGDTAAGGAEGPPTVAVPGHEVEQEGAEEDRLSQAETISMPPSPVRSVFASREPYEPALTRSTGAGRLRFALDGAAAPQHQFSQSFTGTAPVEEDLVDGMRPCGVAEHVPTATIVAQDLRLLHGDALQRAPVSADVATSVKLSGDALLPARTHLGTLASSFRNSVRQTAGSYHQRLAQTSGAPVAIDAQARVSSRQQPAWDATAFATMRADELPLDTSSSKPYQSPTAASTSRVKQHQYEFSQINLLPRFRSKSRSPMRLGSSPKPLDTWLPSSRSPTRPPVAPQQALALQAMAAAEAAARMAASAAVARGDHTGFIAPSEAPAAAEVPGDATMPLEAPLPPHAAHQTLTAGTATAASHGSPVQQDHAARDRSWMGSSPGAGQNSTWGLVDLDANQSQRASSLRSWGADSDGNRHESPDTKSTASPPDRAPSLFTPGPALRPAAVMPTTDRAQREWQRQFLAGGEGAPSSPHVPPPTMPSIEDSHAGEEKANDTTSIAVTNITGLSMLSDMHPVAPVPPSPKYQFVRPADGIASPGALYAVPLESQAGVSTQPYHQAASTPKTDATTQHRQSAGPPPVAGLEQTLPVPTPVTAVHVHVGGSGIDVYRGSVAEGGPLAPAVTQLVSETGPATHAASGAHGASHLNQTTVIRVHRSGSFDVESGVEPTRASPGGAPARSGVSKRTFAESLLPDPIVRQPPATAQARASTRRDVRSPHTVGVTRNGIIVTPRTTSLDSARLPGKRSPSPTTLPVPPPTLHTPLDTGHAWEVYTHPSASESAPIRAAEVAAARGPGELKQLVGRMLPVVPPVHVPAWVGKQQAPAPHASSTADARRATPAPALYVAVGETHTTAHTAPSAVLPVLHTEVRVPARSGSATFVLSANHAEVRAASSTPLTAAAQSEPDTPALLSPTLRRSVRPTHHLASVQRTVLQRQHDELDLRARWGAATQQPLQRSSAGGRAHALTLGQDGTGW